MQGFYHSRQHPEFLDLDLLDLAFEVRTRRQQRSGHSSPAACRCLIEARVRTSNLQSFPTTRKFQVRSFHHINVHCQINGGHATTTWGNFRSFIIAIDTIDLLVFRRGIIWTTKTWIELLYDLAGFVLPVETIPYTLPAQCSRLLGMTPPTGHRHI